MEKRHSRAVLSLVGSICANALRHEPDQKLLQLFRTHHDQHAFRALVEKHQGAVLALARSIVRNEEDAEDVMQAVFLVLARKIKQATQANSLTSWLLGVTYRTAKEAQRQYARRQRIERRVPLDESIPDRNGSAENKAELSNPDLLPFSVPGIMGVSVALDSHNLEISFWGRPARLPSRNGRASKNAWLGLSPRPGRSQQA
jgi:Sigma-70 region 2